MVDFSIILLTYNRPSLLRRALRSLSLQTYRDFTVYLVDNGSSPPVALEDVPGDLKVVPIRHESNRHGADVLNEALERVGGTHVAFLADDDAWSPGTLARVADVFDSSSEVEMLGVGFTGFDHDRGRSLADGPALRAFGGSLHRLDAHGVGIALGSSWGIGPRVSYPLPRLSHSSASFFSRQLVERTRARQPQLFVKPLVDVGLVGLCFNTRFSHYLDLPLAVIGKTAVRGMNGSLAGQRMHWQGELRFLEHSPVRGCSFINVALESHLKVFAAQGILAERDCALRPDFFVLHIEQIASDDPWSPDTQRDLQEAVPLAAESVIRSGGRDAAARGEIESKLWELAESVRRRAVPPPPGVADGPSFPGVVEYAVWQERMLVAPCLCPPRPPAGLPAALAAIQGGLERGELDRVAALLRGYEARFAGNADFETARAEWLYCSGSGDEALSALERVLARNPGHVEALNDLTVVHWEAGRRDLALLHLGRALGQPLHRDVVRNSLAVLPTLGKSEDARIICAHYLETHPGDLEVRGWLEELDRARGQGEGRAGPELARKAAVGG